jgi:hypothetical protein
MTSQRRIRRIRSSYGGSAEIFLGALFEAMPPELVEKSGSLQSEHPGSFAFVST